MPPNPDAFDLAALVPAAPRFHPDAERQDRLRDACARAPGVARFETIGTSEEGRPIAGVRVGEGPRAVSLIAGNHADEPVGPETLAAFVEGVLAAPRRFGALLAAFTFYVVPHTNPDGAARNRAWIERWPDAAAFVAGVEREAPGRDLEFGFPDLRPENRAVQQFLAPHAPFALHMSLHGMAFSEGALLLVERQWAGRTRALREAFAGVVRQHGLPLHDHNREGEKGFFYIAPGFTTTPEGAAMRAHFTALGQPGEAAHFRDSSMEWIRSLGGDPLSLVTEIPLFRVPHRPGDAPGAATAYGDLRGALPEIRAALAKGNRQPLDAWPLEPVALGTAIALQLAALGAGLEQVAR